MPLQATRTAEFTFSDDAKQTQTSRSPRAQTQETSGEEVPRCSQTQESGPTRTLSNDRKYVAQDGSCDGKEERLFDPDADCDDVIVMSEPRLNVLKFAKMKKRNVMSSVTSSHSE
ncbi:hypothetical protein KUCAC02_009563 [Chaenocephalus aceratus]|nr:hypothetical protein KUCAC02_009563 [Chaenocephalus aceratus]